jgi:hypothetical protein
MMQLNVRERALLYACVRAMLRTEGLTSDEEMALELLQDKLWRAVGDE